MGAAATVNKEDVETTAQNSSSTSSSVTNNKKSASMPVLCCACKVSLGFFKRKKCAGCTQVHCVRCLMPRTGCYDGRPVCNKCAVLAMGDYTRDFLATHYTLRELRMFLARQRVNVDGCTDKHDVVEVLMQQRRTTAGRDDDEEHRRHVTQLMEKMSRELREDATDNSAIQSNNRVTPPASSSNISSSTNRVANQSNLPTGPSPSVSRQSSGIPLATDVEETASNNRNARDVGGAVHNADDTSESSARAEDLTQQPLIDNISGLSAGNIDGRSDAGGIPNGADASQSSDAAAPRRITLGEIGSRSDIDGLTVRQLKDLLVNNYVDYKGCCEKQELVNRVHELWTDRERSRKAADGAECQVSDDDLCKVCMDAPIDCILLECGHMVTCTGCGKQLAECPICRRYVSRVVHVFRA